MGNFFSFYFRLTTLHVFTCLILLFSKLLLRFNNKIISFYHISNAFWQYSRRWSNNTKKVQLLNFRRLPVCQFSLDFIFFGFGLFLPISTTYLMSNKIWNARWPLPRPLPPLVFCCFFVIAKNMLLSKDHYKCIIGEHFWEIKLLTKKTWFYKGTYVKMLTFLTSTASWNWSGQLHPQGTEGKSITTPFCLKEADIRELYDYPM